MNLSTTINITSLSVNYRAQKALLDINCIIKSGRITGIFGPNGAGKTTLVNVITGVHPASSGKVVFQGRDISRLKPYQTARMG
ncbi:MAG: ATP-binding cassette domain-containing protein, partial [Aphanizomenon sp.]